MNTIVFALVLSLMAAIAVQEVEKAVNLKNKPIMILSLALSVAIPILVHFNISVPIAAIGGIYVVLVFIFMLLQYEKTKFEEADTAIFASVAIPYSFSLLLVFRDINERFSSYTKIDGIFLILFACFCAWLTDIFAYFVGSKFGKRKLCPKISPKKSVEGAIGGVVGAVVLNVVLPFVFKKFFFEGETGLSYVSVIIMSVCLSVISMFGDLAASTIKRNFGIKDFGKLLPGHGGIMDRCDSLLFVLPVLYSLVYIINLF
jgi:phosphatidate cytidylyltransferase